MREKKVIELREGPGDGQLFNVPHFFYYFTYRDKNGEGNYKRSQETPTNCLVDEVFIFEPAPEEDPGE